MKYKVGDKVRIRRWGDMATEFPIDDDGDILVRNDCAFVKQMRHLCGKEYYITDICDGCYRLNKEGSMWSFTDEMLELVNLCFELSSEVIYKICQISEHYSKGNQLIKTLEELQELRSELLIAETYDDDFVTLTDNTMSECADVIIMCIQLAMQHGKERELKEQIGYKVNRQIERMKSE